MSSRIGRYEIQAELGRGGFGQVFRAYDPTVGRLVAIKTLTAGGDTDLIRRFRNEAAAAGKLRHNNIITIYDFGDHEGSPYLVMELLDGDDLERIITHNRPLNLLDRVDIIAQSAAGLHHAHANGIVHRDVKPANIMLQRDGVVKIMDFGIALLTQATAARLTPKGSLVGTFPYMAPEQFHGSASDALTDIFAFGVTCYKLLTRVHPFHAEEMGGLMYNIMNKAPEPIRALNPDCPEALEQAVFRMLAKDREMRYQSLEDARFDLEPVIAELRKERIHDLLFEARDLIAANQLDAAQGMLRRILETDPTNRTARELREDLQRQIRENEIRPRIAALINEGKEQLQARSFGAAIQKFHSALQLNKSNTELKALIAEAESARDRAERAARLVESVQNCLNRGDLTAARSGVLEALSADPDNIDAQRLRDSVEERITARERERRLEDGLNHARRLMLLESYGQAIEALEALARDHPETSAVRDLLARARTDYEEQKRRERLEAATEEAKTLLKNNRFAEAVERLNAFRAEFPESTELRDLAAFAAEELQSQKQGEAVEKATAEARRFIESHRYDDALNVLRGTLAEYPGASALRDWIQTTVSAKGEYERRTALDEALSQAREHVSKQHFREALERVGAFVRAYGDSSELESIRRDAEEGLEKQRRAIAARQLASRARALLDDGQPDNATKVLQSGTTQFPGDTELMNLLTEAEERLLEQRRSEAISKIISEAESLARARQFDRALLLLDNGLQEHSGSERLIRCRQATVASQTRHQREQALRKCVEEVQALRQNGQVADALARVQSALREFGDSSSLLELRRELENEQSARERDVAVQNLLNDAKTMLDRGQIVSATQILQQGAARFPGEQRLAKLREVAEARAREQERAAEIAKIARVARDHLEAGRYEDALNRLDAGTRQFGAVPDFERIREQALAAKAEQDRRHALDELKKRVRAAQVSGQLAEALEILLGGLKRFGDDPGLVSLKNEVEAEREAGRREGEIRNLARQAQDLLAAGRASEAVALLEKATEFLDRPTIADLLASARERAAEKERERAILEIERNARRLVDGGKYEEAIAAVDSALKQYPGTDRLSELRNSVQAAQERAELLADARSASAAGDPERALAVVLRALERWAGDRELNEMRSRLESELERRRRLETVQKAAAEAEAFIADGRAQAAVAVLRPVLAKYPNEERIGALLRTAEAEHERSEFEKEIAAASKHAESLMAQHRYDDVIAMVNSRFANVDRLKPILAKAQQELELKHQRDAREKALRQMLALEQQIPSTRKSKLAGLLAESRRIAAVYAGDGEFANVAARIARQVEAVLSVPAPRRPPLRWSWIAGGAGALALIGVGVVYLRPTSPAPPKKTPGPVTFPVEIRTDPPGASVTVGGHSCTSPNCRFELTAGSYAVNARLRGYKEAEQTLNLGAPGSATGPTTITLEPEAPAAPASGPIGRLLVRAGAPGARVVIDSVPQGLTDGRGDFSTKLAAGQEHRIRVEKAGYKTPPEQRVSLTDRAAPERLSFKLVPEPARFAIRGAPAGVEVRIGTGAGRRTDGSPVFTMDVQPGNQPVQVRESGTSNQFQRHFEPGDIVTVDWTSIAPVKPAPVPPKPEVRDPWSVVASTTDPNVLESFIRDHPGDPHIEEAARRLDEMVWAATNQSDIRSLQSYVTRFPRGAHIRDALRLSDDLLWRGVNQNSAESLRAFVQQNPGSAHRSEAAQILDRLARPAPPPVPVSQSAASTASAADRQAIRNALQRFNDAFVHKSPKELKEIWPGALKDWLDSLNQRSAYFVATLYPMGDPEVKSDRAMIRCDLITQTILRGQPQPQNRKSVVVTLRRSGDQWLIEDPRGSQ